MRRFAGRTPVVGLVCALLLAPLSPALGGEAAVAGEAGGLGWVEAMAIVLGVEAAPLAQTFAAGGWSVAVGAGLPVEGLPLIQAIGARVVCAATFAGDAGAAGQLQLGANGSRYAVLQLPVAGFGLWRVAVLYEPGFRVQVSVNSGATAQLSRRLISLGGTGGSALSPSDFAQYGVASGTASSTIYPVTDALLEDLYTRAEIDFAALGSVALASFDALAVQAVLLRVSGVDLFGLALDQLGDIPFWTRPEGGFDPFAAPVQERWPTTPPVMIAVDRLQAEAVDWLVHMTLCDSWASAGG